MQFPGMIGNHFSSALIGRNGEVEWCCFPYLDSPSHFGAYFDPVRGGRFQICPQGEFRSDQRYIPGTQVLETLFETPLGTGVVTDWMPLDDFSYSGPTLHREIQILEGQIHWITTCSPRFKNGEDSSHAERHLRGILFRGNHVEDLGILQSNMPIEISMNGSSAIARFTLHVGETAQFIWAWGRRTTGIHSELQTTIDQWRSIAHHCPAKGCIFGGPWHELVTRSGLVLKLLFTSYANTVAEGVAISSPPSSGQGRPTWGDRYASIRGGSSIIRALANLGYAKESQNHFFWLSDILERDGVENLQPLYTLDGGKIYSPSTHAPSTQDSHRTQRFQLDIYGHVILAAHEYYKIFGHLPPGVWSKLIDLADYLCQAWKRPDHGPQGASPRAEHFVTSKVYCWAALNQIGELALALGQLPSPRWTSEKVILHKTICDQGFDTTKNSFVRSFGGREMDASILSIFTLDFLPLNDPRILGTLDRIHAELSTGVLLKHSLQNDDSHTEAGIDLFSSFLLISCLALAGKTDEASDRMAELCTYASPLGLFSNEAESLDHPDGLPRSFPSASIHCSLINAALSIGLAKGRHQQQRLLA